MSEEEPLSGYRLLVERKKELIREFNDVNLAEINKAISDAHKDVVKAYCLERDITIPPITIIPIPPKLFEIGCCEYTGGIWFKVNGYGLEFVPPTLPKIRILKPLKPGVKRLEYRPRWYVRLWKKWISK